ncbi:MAG TPA: PAS domain-containing protein, partial [Mucilaginibacter sp.]|nr:PAS domain-containing protein [Mucilaginibacter sp.]
MRNHPEQLYHLLQSIAGIMWEAGTDMRRFTLMTGLVEPMLGCTPECCLDQHDFWEKHIHPDDRAVLADYRQLFLTPGKIITLEYRIVRPDGQLVWIRDYAGVYERNGEVLLRGLMQDQTPAERLSAL